MGCTSDCTLKNGGQAPKEIAKPKEETVGEYLDRNILEARLHLERMCITKAKAEATQMLDHPITFLRQILSPGYEF